MTLRSHGAGTSMPAKVAIATAAQVWHHERDRAEATILAFFSALAGRPLSVNRAVYASERQTGHRNRAISHLLRNAEVIEEEPEPGLDLYFRQCSIDVTCRDLAVMAATLACQGRNPLTQEQPLDAATTTRVRTQPSCTPRERSCVTEPPRPRVHNSITPGEKRKQF